MPWAPILSCKHGQCSLAGRGILHNMLPSLFPHFDLQDGAQGLPLITHAPLAACHDFHLLQGPPVPHPQPEPHGCCKEGPGLMLQPSLE